MFTKKNHCKKSLFKVFNYSKLIIVLCCSIIHCFIWNININSKIIDNEINIISRPVDENKNLVIEELDHDYCESIIKRNLNGTINLYALSFNDIKAKLSELSSQIDNDTEVSLLKKIGLEYSVKLKLEGNTFHMRIIDLLSNVSIDSKIQFKKLSNAVCNKITNSIYEEIYGMPGFFDKKILFVEKKRNLNNLETKLGIMNVNDSNSKIYLQKNTNEIILTPDYSPARKEIVYSTISKPLEGSSNKSWNRLNVLNLKTKKHQDISEICNKKLRNQKIISPRYSKDGKFLFFSILGDKNSNTFMYQLDTSSCKLSKITKKGISVSPSLTRDGKYLVFQSDKDSYLARPDIYIKNITNNFEIQLTNRGVFHEPEVSEDGSKIIFIKKINNRSYLGIIDTYTTEESIIFSEYSITNPSFSPDGNFIIFNARERNSKNSKLNIIDYRGNLIKVINDSSNYYDPIWI